MVMQPGQNRYAHQPYTYMYVAQCILVRLCARLVPLSLSHALSSLLALSRFSAMRAFIYLHGVNFIIVTDLCP